MMNFDFSPLWLSLKTAILATAVTFFFGILAARWMLDYRGRLRGIIDGILISPLVLPPTVVGFLLLLLLGKNSPIGQFLHQLGIDIIFTWKAAIITSIVVSFPLMYRTSLGAFEQIDRNIILAARTLGSTEWIVFWRVMLPLAYRGIVAATILAFARALGEFGATLMLAGNIPGQTQTMPLAIFFASESGDYQQALIWVLVLLSISLSVIIIVNFWAESKVNRNLKTRKIKSRESRASEPPPASIRNYSGLFVDIEKQYPGFFLTATLENNGQPLGILGASGSGKSMTLRCIAGLETPDRGIINVNGKIWFDARQKINLPSHQRRVGFMFQNYALFPHLTVWQNIAFGLRKLPLSEQKQRVRSQIDRMQLQALENHYPHEISGGQQQRVALARALAIEPEVLLLDEPFSALDTQLRSQMEHQLIETLATYKGETILVSHNLEEVYRICQQLMVIDRGKILTHGDKREIFVNPKSYAVAKLTGCKNFSRTRRISPNQIEAIDWACSLTVNAPIPPDLTHIGIRAHHLIFTELNSLKHQNRPLEPIHAHSGNGEVYLSLESLTDRSIAPIDTPTENTFPCWLVQTSETPHRMTIYLKLNHPPQHLKDYHLQVELFKENWLLLSQIPSPWQIRLDRDRLFLLSDPLTQLY